MKNEELFSLNEVTRPPLRYHGGKFRLAPWIIPQIPPHRHYVEVFGGAAGVLLRKTRSHVEVYNDLDSQVVNLFKILRNREDTLELCRMVELTPFSREEFNNSYEPSLHPLEAARRFIVRCYFGHGTCSVDPKDSNGYRSCDVRAGKSYAREWTGIPLALSVSSDRFKGVTIENIDYRKLIPKFDTSETFFYVDPPYTLGSRNAGGKGYVHEMSDEDHRQLSWILHRVKGKAAISGYPSSLYDDLYSDWRKDTKEVGANGQRGSVKRVECLWMNYQSNLESKFPV